MRKKCRWNRSRRIVPVLGLAILIAGCRATPAYQGSQRDILATFRIRRLSADLPATIRVPAAMAASRAALQGRGYAIQSAATTEDSGELTAVPADAGVLESVSVFVRQSSGGTRIQIIVEPLGSQTKSRAILDAILTNLGL